MVFVKASNDLVGKPVAGLIGRKPPLGKPDQTGAVRTDPQLTVAIRKKCQDAGSRKTVVLVVCAEAPLAIFA